MVKKKKKRPIQKLPKAEKGIVFSYKQPEILKRYLSEQGYIASRERSGLSLKQQRQLSREIKRARHLALLPFTQTL